VPVTFGGFSIARPLDEEETRVVGHRESGFALSIPRHPRAAESTPEHNARIHVREEASPRVIAPYGYRYGLSSTQRAESDDLRRHRLVMR